MRSSVFVFIIVLLGCGREGTVTSDAGEDQIAEAGEEIILIGSGTSRENEPLSYEWYQSSNHELTIRELHEEAIAVQIPSHGVGKRYTFNFVVADGAGNEATDTVDIVVVAEQAQPRMMADFKYKRLLFPISDAILSSPDLNPARDLVANSRMWVQSIEGAPVTQSAFDAVMPGDYVNVEVAYVDGRNRLITEDWELHFTNLPVVNIEPRSTIVNEPKRTAQFTLLDNINDVLFESEMGIEFRGNTSLAYTKKNFDIELWKGGHRSANHKDEKKVELLGMRDDGDWILDAMYVDYSRMRNRVAMDLWNDFSVAPDWSDKSERKFGTTGKYVEVLMDGRYHGLYVLSEQIDRKQVDVRSSKGDTPRGLLYKADYWGTLDAPLASKFEEDITITPTDDEYWLGWQLKYPKKPSLEAWQPLQDFYRFVTSSSDSEFSDEIEDWVNLDNMIDYLLFLNVIGGNDNQGKNTFFAVYDVTSLEKDDRKFIYLPWDLDATFGRYWDSVPYSQNIWLSNVLFDRLRENSPSSFRSRLTERWHYLRKNHFSRADITNRFNDYYDQVSKGGAMAREAERWNRDMINTKGTGLELESELEYIDSWLQDRLVWMDDYIEERFDVSE